MNYIFICEFLMLCVLMMLAVVKKNGELKNRIAYLFILTSIWCFVFYTGKYSLGILLALVVIAGGKEVMDQASGNKLIGYACLIVAVILTFRYAVVSNLFLIPYALMTIYLLKAKTFIGKNSWNGYGFLIFVVGYGSVCLEKLYLQSPAIVFAAWLMIVMNDTGGYFGGKIWGKYHIVKSISPNKTLEGYLVGLLEAGLSLVISYFLLPELRAMTIGFLVFFWFYMGVFSNIGDLLFSAFKRKLNIKDYSNFLGKHGGVLDRFDDVLFFSPVLVFILNCLH